MSIWSSIWNGVKSVGSSLLGIGGSVASGFINAASSAASSKQQYNYQTKLNQQSYKYNLSLQQQAQKWQQKNISTAHQTEVSDMRKAGLNPILSATGGSGAAVGSVGGSSVSGGSAGMPDIDPISAYATYKQVKNDTALKDSQVSLNDYQSKLLRSQEKGAVWDALLKQQTYDDVVPLQIKQIEAQNESIRANTAADISLKNAQADSIRAQTAGQLITNGFLPRTLESAIGSAASNARYMDERSRGFSGGVHAGPFGFSVNGNSPASLTRPFVQANKEVARKIYKRLKK